jgi:hypothetical protein
VVMLDLPTPPLPDRTSTICLMFRSGIAVWDQPGSIVEMV